MRALFELDCPWAIGWQPTLLRLGSENATATDLGLESQDGERVSTVLMIDDSPLLPQPWACAVQQPRQLSGVKRTFQFDRAAAANDAVDGAHSAASKRYRVNGAEDREPRKRIQCPEAAARCGLQCARCRARLVYCSSTLPRVVGLAQL